ncbi:MAG: hypothetical protein CMJ84_08205 [Planctomycetes bacterium]|nr:hypothetical protein [Planctomycetota bacterium]MDP6407771.1 hypothetical protein [Planctomycetota bacterium]
MFRLLVALALLLTLGACRALKNFDLIEIADAKAHNLAELHPREGRHAYVATLVGDVEYLLRQGLRGTGASAMAKDPGAIDVPETECLEALLALARFDATDERVASLQVLWACRVATECPWDLSRERAVRELGTAAVRLEVGPPAALAPDVTPDGAAAVGRALGRVMAALGEPEDADRGGADDLSAACDGLRALVLDVPGGRRVLFGLAQLLADPRREEGETELLREVQRATEVRCIAQTLATSLGDGSPRVRVAAVEAAVRSGGRGVLAILLDQLQREPSDEVSAAVLRLVAAEGLPRREEDIDPADFARARESLLAQLVRFAVEHPTGPVRVQAMLALTRVVGGGPESLRAEDWEDWWLARSAAGVSAPVPAGTGR